MQATVYFVRELDHGFQFLVQVLRWQHRKLICFLVVKGPKSLNKLGTGSYDNDPIGGRCDDPTREVQLSRRKVPD